MVLFLLLSLPLLAVTIDELQNSGEYLYGMGEADSYEKATDLALQNLISKISVKVEADFTRKDSEDEYGFKSRVERNINTYSSTTLYNVPDIMEQSKDKTVVWRYLKKADLDKIFAARRQKILSYYNCGLEAEAKCQIGDALRNYYWSMELLSTYPEKECLCPENDEITLQTQLPNKINSLLDGTNFNLLHIYRDVGKNRKVLKYLVTYAEKSVTNLNYRYYTSADGWSRYTSVNDGLAYIELPLDYSEPKLALQIQYRYEQAANFDKEVLKVLSGIEADYFNNNQRELILIGEEEDINTEKLTLDVFNISKNESTGELKEKDILEDVIKDIREGNKEDIKNCFTETGYSDYENILCYGKADIMEDKYQMLLEESPGEKQFRNLPMRFSFPGNEAEFIERVNFKFDDKGRIKGITFSLSDRTIRDIMAKDERMWKPEEKYQLINFMEYYKTAYCLEDIDYINNIFAENALIIVGRILKNDDFDIENITDTIDKEKVEYIRYEKDEYIEHLRQVFAANEYVNLQFEDSDIKHYSNDPDSALYAIQIKQNYASQNYGDQGYLFLMMDLQEIEKPKIYIRTWQPEKFADGTVFGVDDFRMN
ncbi:MAG: LPP20 family lipoprotein [Candidatus Stygibacter frigidus]|nr:LPP20 family lipoprotein [Candidatus Stygibacter frigidus]